MGGDYSVADRIHNLGVLRYSGDPATQETNMIFIKDSERIGYSAVTLEVSGWHIGCMLEPCLRRGGGNPQGGLSR
jgi:hypothetical protein